VRTKDNPSNNFCGQCDVTQERWDEIFGHKSKLTEEDITKSHIIYSKEIKKVNEIWNKEQAQ
jgi:hypothetical protein